MTTTRSAALLWLLTLLAACGESMGTPPPDAGGDDAALPDAGPGDDAAAPDAGPPPTCPEGTPLGDYYGKLLVEATINGHGPFQVIYDTGAPESAMDTATAAVVGDGPYTIEVGGETVTLDDLAVFSASATGIPGVEAILGYDVMGSYAVTIDVSRGRFWMDDALDEASLRACDHVDGDPVEVPFVRSSYLYVQGNAEGMPVWFLVDTGASLGAVRTLIYTELDSRHPRPALDGVYTEAAIGSFWGSLTSIGYLEVAGRRVSHIVSRTVPTDVLPAPRLGDDPTFGVLPSGFLKHFMLTVDHPRGVIRLDAYAGDPMVEPSVVYPVGISPQRSSVPPVLVGSVIPGSAADEAGVLPGDEIVSVDGIDMDTMDPSSWAWALMDRDPGVMKQVVLRRAGETLTVRLETRDLLTDPDL